MVSILTIGLAQAELAGAGDAGDHPAGPVGDGEVEALLDASAEGVARGRRAVVIHPAWGPKRASHDIAVVRSLLQSDRLTAYATPLPPLAAGVLVALATVAAAQGAPAGQVAAALPRLETRLHWLARLATVARLRTPAPSLRQHLASAWPGSAFLATSWPEPSVRLVGARAPMEPPPPRDEPIGVVVSTANGSDDWPSDVAGVLGGPPMVASPASPLRFTYWGTDKVAEAVLHPLDVAAFVAGVLAEVETRPCRWCEEPVADPVCPFCNAVTPVVSVAAGVVAR